MIIYAADDPLVLDGTYDIEGYKPGERARLEKARVRQLATEEEGTMPKKKKPAIEKPRAKAGRKKWSAHRVNRHPANGGLPESQAVAPAEDEHVPVGEAMRRAVEALGDVAVDPGLAPTQMIELGECYEQVARMQAAFDTRSEAAKTAKKSLESAQALLLEKVRSFTHPTPLPLFDQQQAEQDLEAMTEA